MNLFIKQTRVVEVPVTTLNICQDIMAMTTLLDADGAVCGHAIFPMWIPQVLEIDLATGQIKNWQVPTGEQLQHIADAYADGQSAAVAPTKLQAAVALVESPDFFKNRFGGRHTPDPVEVEPIKNLEFDGIKTDEPAQGIVDSHFAEVEEGIVMFGGVVPDAEQATNPAPTQVPESAAVRDDLQADCAPADHQSNLVESNQIKPTQREQFAEFLAQRGIEPNAPKPTNQITVHYDHLAEKWHAETDEHQATSTIGKFEAIKNVLKKAGLHGVYEINYIEDGLYGYDGSRTLNADTVYMTQGADGSWSARMPNNRPVSAVIGIDGALTGLLKEMEGIQPEDAVIIETTDDEMRSRNKRRYAVTAKHEHAQTDPLPTITDTGELPSDYEQIDIEDVIEPNRPPARPRYRNPDDHTQTWTGRGKPPEWLQAKLDAGDQLTDYAISDSAA